MRYCNIMNIWEKTTIDAKGKAVIPQTIRDHLGIRKGDKILWISADQRKKPSNDKSVEYLLNIAIIPKK